MNHHYNDITSRIPEKPQWWDEQAVPRYCQFSPDEIACIYAIECALVQISCQRCGREFDVAFSQSALDRIRQEVLSRRNKTLANSILDGSLHYGDPPNDGCCPAGPTMNCNDLRVLEYWRRDRLEWNRYHALEIELPDASDVRDFNE